MPFKSLLREFVTIKPFEQEPKGLRSVQRIDQHGYQKKMPEKVDFRSFDDKGRPEVKILTYNIWFEKITKERIGEVMRVIEEADADFICL